MANNHINIRVCVDLSRDMTAPQITEFSRRLQEMRIEESKRIVDEIIARALASAITDEDQP